MELTWTAFLIVCPFVFLAGFVDSIAGGGGLISLPAYLMSGLPPHYAVGTNKMSSICGTFVSTIRYARNGCVIANLVLPSVAAALIGSAFGAQLVLMADEKWIRYLLLVVVPVVAVLLFVKKDALEDREEEMPYGKRACLVSVISLAVGVYDGFYGPGTGTFLALSFTGIARLNVKHATGNAKCVNLASNLAALTTFLLNGNVVVPLGIAAALCNMAGGYLGSGLVVSKGARIVRPLLLVVMVLLLFKVITD